MTREKGPSWKLRKKVLPQLIFLLRLRERCSHRKIVMEMNYEDVRFIQFYNI